jgi:CubicO group peptidase (beta-lactamase class C family)
MPGLSHGIKLAVQPCKQPQRYRRAATRRRCSSPWLSPPEPDDHFRIGSVTKTFTPTAILQLVDEHKTSLDDRLARYVTGIPYGDQITIAQLLGMTSGVYDFVNDPEFVAAYVANPRERGSTT